MKGGTSGNSSLCPTGHGPLASEPLPKNRQRKTKTGKDGRRDRQRETKSKQTDEERLAKIDKYGHRKKEKKKERKLSAE